MSRDVLIFKGDEITDVVIKKIKLIAKERYSWEIYDNYFDDINNVSDLVHSHSSNIYDEVVVLGNDWFLCYEQTIGAISILEWVAIDNNHKIKQSIEMMTTLKQIFLENNNVHFYATMRHDSSYKIYLKMLKRNYFTEIYHDTFVDSVAPENFLYFQEECYASVEDFLSSEESKEYNEYLKYVLHQVIFVRNQKLLDDYSLNYKRKLKDKIK